MRENAAVPKDRIQEEDTHPSVHYSRREGNSGAELSVEEYADAVADLIRLRLGRRPKDSQPVSRPVIHRDFTFGGVELLQNGPEPRFWIWFGWHGVGNSHHAEVAFARFKAGADGAGGGPALCVSLILQELEEDLTAGPATSFDDFSAADLGLRFQ
jgi:hypothetical protein